MAVLQLSGWVAGSFPFQFDASAVRACVWGRSWRWRRIWLGVLDGVRVALDVALAVPLYCRRADDVADGLLAVQAIRAQAEALACSYAQVVSDQGLPAAQHLRTVGAFADARAGGVDPRAVNRDVLLGSWLADYPLLQAGFEAGGLTRRRSTLTARNRSNTPRNASSGIANILMVRCPGRSGWTPSPAKRSSPPWTRKPAASTNKKTVTVAGVTVTQAAVWWGPIACRSHGMTSMGDVNWSTARPSTRPMPSRCWVSPPSDGSSAEPKARSSTSAERYGPSPPNSKQPYSSQDAGDAPTRMRRTRHLAPSRPCHALEPNRTPRHPQRANAVRSTQQNQTRPTTRRLATVRADEAY